VQAQFVATRIGATEIISAARRAVQVRANLVSTLMLCEKLYRVVRRGQDSYPLLTL
jgi:hypothetical protein